MNQKKFLDVIRKWADKHNFWFPKGEMEGLADEISKVALPELASKEELANQILKTQKLGFILSNLCKCCYKDCDCGCIETCPIHMPEEKKAEKCRHCPYMKVVSCTPDSELARKVIEEQRRSIEKLTQEILDYLSIREIREGK